MYGSSEEGADVDVESGQYTHNSPSAPIGSDPGAQIEGGLSFPRRWSNTSEDISSMQGHDPRIIDAACSPSLQDQAEQSQVKAYKTERCKQGFFNFFRGLSGPAMGIGSGVVGSTILQGAGYVGHDSQEAMAAGAAIGGSIFVGLRSVELFAANCAVGRGEQRFEQTNRMSSFVLQVVGAISSAAAGYLMFSPEDSSEMSAEQLIAAMAVGTTVTAGAISFVSEAKSYLSS